MNIRSWRSRNNVRRFLSRLLIRPLAALIGLTPVLCFGAAATQSLVIDADHEVVGLDFSPTGDTLAIDTQGGVTDIWNFAHKKMVARLQAGGIQLWATDVVRFSPDGRQLAICLNHLSVFDTSTWTKISMPDAVGPGNRLQNTCQNGLAFSPDGRSLVAILGTVFLVYDTSTWLVSDTVLTTHSAHDQDMAPKGVHLTDPSDPDFTFDDDGGALAFSSDGRYLSLGGYSFSTKPWHPGEGMMPPGTAKTVVVDLEKKLVARQILGGVSALAQSPVEPYIAIGGSDPAFSVEIVNTTTGDVVASEKKEPQHVLLRYTPDGKYLIEKIGKVVEIWDGPHHHLLQTIHAEPSCIAVSKDSRHFALGGSPNSILDATILLSMITHPNGPPGKVIVYSLK